MAETQTAEWMILYVCSSRQPEEPAGIVIVDSNIDRVLVKLKVVLDSNDDDIKFIWPYVTEDLMSQSETRGAVGWFRSLEEIASNAIRLSERVPIQIGEGNAEQVLDLLYLQNIRVSSKAAP